MKTFKETGKRKAILFICALSASAILFANPAPGFAQTDQDEKSSTMKWQWSDDGEKLSVEVHGQVDFTDDYTDVKSVSDGGFVRIKEDRQGMSRRFEVKAGANGQLLRAFYLNGEKRGIDDTARKWITEILLHAVRQGAIDVDKRVVTLLRTGGVKGVLEEIERVSGDYGKRIYFVSLIKNESLSHSERASALRESTQQITSDFERANLLKSTAPMLLADSSLRTAFFKGVDTIRSDFEHRGVLSALLKRKPLSEQVLSQMLDSAARIPSDYEKASFLLEASSAYAGNARLHSAFLKTVDTIKSEYERGRVRSALLKNKQISQMTW